ncbi:hypothetical protein WN51_00525 [Melipona quadrifasciata]|uniref:Uncharacterized protein n=1 Tax=Melipona quadrifasciata TaxID=166423 RepID=A0A0M9A000_9HYME|nr:hypothetical protein WN51_00525 [Melipona quadrifasciata]
MQFEFYRSTMPLQTHQCSMPFGSVQATLNIRVNLCPVVLRVPARTPYNMHHARDSSWIEPDEPNVFEGVEKENRFSVTNTRIPKKYSLTVFARRFGSTQRIMEHSNYKNIVLQYDTRVVSRPGRACEFRNRTHIHVHAHAQSIEAQRREPEGGYRVKGLYVSLRKKNVDPLGPGQARPGQARSRRAISETLPDVTQWRRNYGKFLTTTQSSFFRDATDTVATGLGQMVLSLRTDSTKW